jgi:hypothetical protein
VNHRADLYSLGGVLYALVAGRPPFVAKSIPEMLHKQRFEVPDPLRRFSNDVPDELADIVAQLLEKEPDKRITNAMILARRLEAMVHGLSLRASRASALGTTRADSQLILPDPAADGYNLIDPSAQTNVDPSVLRRKSIALRANEQAGLGETQVTSDVHPQEAAGLSMIDRLPKPGAGTRFTTIEDEKEESSDWREILSTLVSPQTWVLAAALLFFGLGAYWMLLPASADKLYERITRRASDEAEDSLLEAADDIDQFLTHYSGDSRSREVEKYQDDVERIRLEKRFARRARRLDNAVEFSTVERAYAAAMQDAQLDPQRTVERLRALLALYEDEASRGTTGTDNLSLCIQLAQKQMVKFSRLAESYRSQDIAMLRERLERAAVLQEEGAADQAVKIYQAIVELYRDEPWAAEFVQQAENELKPPI